MATWCQMETNDVDCRAAERWNDRWQKCQIRGLIGPSNSNNSLPKFCPHLLQLSFAFNFSFSSLWSWVGVDCGSRCHCVIQLSQVANFVFEEEIHVWFDCIHNTNSVPFGGRDEHWGAISFNIPENHQTEMILRQLRYLVRNGALSTPHK